MQDFEQWENLKNGGKKSTYLSCNATAYLISFYL